MTENNRFWLTAGVLLVVLLVATAALLAPAAAAAVPAGAAPDVVEAQAPADAGQRLRQALADLGDFRGRFEQRVVDPRGRTVQSSQGTVALRRARDGQPGAFRWETTAPFPQVLVSDGSTVWLHDPDLEQVTVRRLQAAGGRTPVRLLAGDLAELDRAFNVQQVPVQRPDMPAGAGQVWLLVPIGDDALFTDLVLAFDADGGLLQMELTDAMGQRTRVDFADLTTEVDPTLFEFQVPDGVDVIDDTASPAVSG